MLLGEPLGRDLLLLAQRPHELLAHDVLDLPTDHGHVCLGVDHDLHHRSSAVRVQLEHFTDPDVQHGIVRAVGDDLLARVVDGEIRLGSAAWAVRAIA